jgi:hypothetical protein
MAAQAIHLRCEIGSLNQVVSHVLPRLTSYAYNHRGVGPVESLTIVGPTPLLSTRQTLIEKLNLSL